MTDDFEISFFRVFGNKVLTNYIFKWVKEFYKEIGYISYSYEELPLEYLIQYQRFDIIKEKFRLGERYWLALDFSRENMSIFLQEVEDFELFKMVFENYRETVIQTVNNLTHNHDVIIVCRDYRWVNYMVEEGLVNLTTRYKGRSILLDNIRCVDIFIFAINTQYPHSHFYNFSKPLTFSKLDFFKYLDLSQNEKRDDVVHCIYNHGTVDQLIEIVGTCRWTLLERLPRSIPMLKRHFEMVKWLCENKFIKSSQLVPMESLASYENTDALNYVNSKFGNNNMNSMDWSINNNDSYGFPVIKCMEIAKLNPELFSKIPLKHHVSNGVPLDIIKYLVNYKNTGVFCNFDTLSYAKSVEELEYLLTLYYDTIYYQPPSQLLKSPFFNNMDIKLLEVLNKNRLYLDFSGTEMGCYLGNLEGLKYHLENLNSKYIIPSSFIFSIQTRNIEVLKYIMKTQPHLSNVLLKNTGASFLQKMLNEGRLDVAQYLMDTVPLVLKEAFNLHFHGLKLPRNFYQFYEIILPRVPKFQWACYFIKTNIYDMVKFFPNNRKQVVPGHFDLKLLIENNYLLMIGNIINHSYLLPVTKINYKLLTDIITEQTLRIIYKRIESQDYKVQLFCNWIIYLVKCSNVEDLCRIVQLFKNIQFNRLNLKSFIILSKSSSTILGQIENLQLPTEHQAYLNEILNNILITCDYNFDDLVIPKISNVQNK
ncbi:hypothetical protein DLAC_11602 [Tieghemostelium lacteum]|uniref:Uncharacterized protein n=1 Tax=Tieghemostelium lacteum TaxID=361077 RepID=A0A151ZKI4_TIELA|nr:hypothetical protein DLAC_11602 [Tieghemostelium lacteum]|eukprot:KYQ94437.1 hypothetical protein DLAC_11602 [Tieghemostelium lacteum]